MVSLDPASWTRRDSVPRRNLDQSNVRFPVLVPPLLGVAAGAWVGLGVDVQYVLGGLITAEAGGVGGANEIFVHRPLIYRLFMAALQQIAEFPTDDPSGLPAQLVVRLVACILVITGGVAVWWGLRRHVDETSSRLITIAATVALCAAPNFHFLTADWVGAALAFASVGAALGPRRGWVGGLIGGLLLWSVLAVKVATAPWAVLTVGLVALFTLQRAVLASIVASTATLLWIVGTSWLDPLEILWLRDSVRTNFASPLQTGFGTHEATELVRVLANVVIVSPILVALPAALMVIIFHNRSRTTGAVVSVLAVGLSLASGVGQGRWYAYHFVGLPRTTCLAMRPTQRLDTWSWIAHGPTSTASSPVYGDS